MASSPAIIDGKYELVELAGEGGMASVYRAQVRGAAGFSRTVAIKKIKPEFRTIRNYTDMFIEEARVGAELAHPNIVQVYDFCADEHGSYYIVMEWVEGMDLGSFVKFYQDRGGHMPWPLAVAAAIGTLRGLGAAHERRRSDGTPAPIIHRDVSPHNILVGNNGVAKLTDFGLARARDRVFSLTAPGTVKGKLSYLSPEVALGGEATTQSDLFAMGAVLWESLAGQRLFDGRNDLEVFKMIRQCVVRPLRDYRPDLPDELIAVVNGALAREPATRFGSAAAFASMLGEVLRMAPPAGDSQPDLGAAVAEARRQLGVAKPAAVLNSDHVPTQKWQAPPVSDPGRRTPRPPPLPPQSRASAAAPPPVPKDDSIDIEFSKPDLTVEPLPLTKPKRRDP